MNIHVYCILFTGYISPIMPAVTIFYVLLRRFHWQTNFQEDMLITIATKRNVENPDGTALSKFTNQPYLVLVSSC